MIAVKKWIISSPTPFSTLVGCDKIFTYKRAVLNEKNLNKTIYKQNQKH
jgi:hypothetical protein